MRSCAGRQRGSQRPRSPRWPKRCTYLVDLGVGATAAAVAGMHPGSRHVSGAVGTQGAAALSHAPAALEARVSFEAEATALPQGRALVEVGCRGKHSQPGQATVPPPVPPHRLTLNVLRVIDDEVAVPHHRQVHRQVADVIALVGVLRTVCSAVRPKPREAGQGLCTPPGHGWDWMLGASSVGQALGASPVQTSVSNPERGTQQKHLATNQSKD